MLSRDNSRAEYCHMANAPSIFQLNPLAEEVDPYSQGCHFRKVQEVGGKIVSASRTFYVILLQSQWEGGVEDIMEQIDLCKVGEERVRICPACPIANNAPDYPVTLYSMGIHSVYYPLSVPRI